MAVTKPLLHRREHGYKINITFQHEKQLPRGWFCFHLHWWELMLYLSELFLSWAQPRTVRRSWTTFQLQTPFPGPSLFFSSTCECKSQRQEIWNTFYLNLAFPELKFLEVSLPILFFRMWGKVIPHSLDSCFSDGINQPLKMPNQVFRWQS